MKSEATNFEFTSYKFEPDKKRIVFRYKTEFKDKNPLLFTETILLPKIPNVKSIPSEAIKKLLESLHIMLGISYYKFYCATKVKLHYDLSKREADFWNTVYKKGLGEFFYKNNLDPKISPKFPYSKNKKIISFPLEKNDKCLVGIGGGKDSIVSSDLLLKNGFDINAFVVKTSHKEETMDNIVKAIGVDNLCIERFLDEKVFQNHQYNGHIPVSAIYAFLGVLSCVLYKYSYFIVSNEYSSNFGNITYKGETINHQWSKSFEFESLFQDYIKDVISPDVYYFSLLRSFYEIRIVKMFSKLKKYFPIFSSCNRNFSIHKTDNVLWCCNCAKCVFVFTLLSAFLSKKELISIFGKNLYQDETLLPLFKDILGFGKMKPFDCVGTFEESNTAFHMASKKFKNDFIVKSLLSKTKIYPEVLKTNISLNIPEQFKLLGMDSALILGYGKEGKATKEYLKKYHANLKIGITDEKQRKNYLIKQKDFDIAIKTPGIPKDLLKIPHTTATNIFFSKITGKNTIIGITGSKGKSTTSSLIFAILKESGKDVRLLGNIGKPMLEELMKPVKKDVIFVLELSSYQLDDITFPPNISVVTNLFPEHMDYHKGAKNYFNAKKNIINFQGKNDYFIFNPNNKKSAAWAKECNGKAVPFIKSIPLDDSELPLIGEHNKDNMKAAIAAAKIFNINDSIIKSAIKKFKGLPHRLEFIGEFKGIKFYDDAISTTPDSTIMAIRSISNIETIFLGGQDRGYDFSNLEKTIKKYKIKNVVLFPDSGKGMFKKNDKLNILKTSNMSEAVKFAYKNTNQGGVCLLSCASPSYSLWKNFEEKGDQFKYFVKKLSK